MCTREQGTVTLPEASRYGDIKHTQLFLKLQKVFLHEGEKSSWQFTPNYSWKWKPAGHGRKKSSASEQRKSQELYLFRWLGPKTCFTSITDQSFCLSPATKETSKPLASRPHHGQGCRAPRQLADRLWKCLGRTGQRSHLSSLALQRPEDTTQLCCEDRKIISGRSPGNAFMRTHAQVQGVHAILSICNTSKVQKSG